MAQGRGLARGESGKSRVPSVASWASEERIVQVPAQTAALSDLPLAPAPPQMQTIPGGPGLRKTWRHGTSRLKTWTVLGELGLIGHLDLTPPHFFTHFFFI